MGVRKKFPKYLPGAVYRNRQEPAGTRYGYLMPAEYAKHCVIGDCWRCDPYGEVDPEYCVCPVPFHASDVGPLVRVVGHE